MQLREAQRGLRERKNRHLEELQARVAELEKENASLKSITRSPRSVIDWVIDNVEFLTSFTYPSFEQPSHSWPMSFTAGSLAAQDPSFAQISLTYDYDKFITERTIPIVRPLIGSSKPLKLSKST